MNINNCTVGEFRSNIVSGQLYEANFDELRTADTYRLNCYSTIDRTDTISLIGMVSPNNKTEEGREITNILKDKFQKGDKVFVEFEGKCYDDYTDF
ncbi:MAG: hypothetical protein K2G63_04465 [Oscillospiraceae bacterium]|nr:hypothetical protein [Oscillospiraceae bacterium]